MNRFFPEKLTKPFIFMANKFYWHQYVCIELTFIKIKCRKTTSIMSCLFLLMYVWKCSWKLGLHSLQHCSVDWGNFHMNNFLQTIQCMELTHMLWGFPIRNNHTWTNQETEESQGMSEKLEMKQSSKRGQRCSGCVNHYPILLKQHTLNRHTFLL